ncbi:MAG: C40 family peptidase [Acidobacteria bacterium]|nr:C40 family peptidase [Acidobacteriota bacterium]
MTLRRAVWPCLCLIILAAGISGCAGQQPKPQVLPPGARVSVSGAAVARTAETLLGSPYREGGVLPNGFDCSGLVCYVFARHGVGVPRDVRRQATVGRAVTRDKLKPGDLLFFTTTGPGPTHVAIAIDHDHFVHAPKTGAVVRVESLQSAYWAKRLLQVRRLTG